MNKPIATKFTIQLPKIKNCPFCGSEASETFETLSTVMCNNPKCRAKISNDINALEKYLSENNY